MNTVEQMRYYQPHRSLASAIFRREYPKHVRNTRQGVLMLELDEKHDNHSQIAREASPKKITLVCKRLGLNKKRFLSIIANKR